MSQARLAADLTDDAILYSLAASVAFLAGYVAFARGYRTPIGRSLITLDAGLILLYVPSALHRFFGLGLLHVGFAWYYLGTILVVGSAVWWRAWIMMRAQWRSTRKGARQ